MNTHRNEATRPCTHEQMQTLLNLYMISNEGCISFTQFMDRCDYDHETHIVYLRWRGQTVGISTTGYNVA